MVSLFFKILFSFYLFFSTMHATCGILVSWLGIKPMPPAWKHGFLTTRLPGKSLVCLFITILFALQDTSCSFQFHLEAPEVSSQHLSSTFTSFSFLLHPAHSNVYSTIHICRDNESIPLHWMGMTGVFHACDRLKQKQNICFSWAICEITNSNEEYS